MRIDEFFPSVQTRVGAVAAPVLADCARRALAVFFKHSDCWRKTIGASVVSTGSGEFRLDSVSPEAISDLISIRPEGGVNLGIKSEATMDAERPQWREETAQKAQRCVKMRDGTILLHPAPELAQSYFAEVSLYPTKDTQEIPDAIGEEWFDALVDGIVGEVSDIDGKPYSDPARAEKCKARLISAARDARVRTNRSGVREVAKVRLTTFEEL